MRRIKFVYGLEYKRLLPECIDLDKAMYENKYVGKLDIYECMHKTNPAGTIFAIDIKTGCLAGYINSASLSQESYDKIKTGEIIDTESIEKKDIISIDDSGLIYIYSLVVNPLYQGQGIARMLFDKLMSNLIYENTKSILADAINPKVFDMMLEYNFSPTKVTNHESVIMEMINSNLERKIV